LAGRLDPQHVEATRHKVLEQVPVVGGDLDDLAAGAESEALDDRVGVSPRVGDPAVGIRGKVCVLRKDLLRRHDLVELHQQALPANQRMQRVEPLGLAQPIRPDIGLAQRRHPEIDERVLEARPAEAASM
jgi:hypothetical protein